MLGILKETPCDFWREHADQYPTLAALARDIFSIPATGAGVERLFNSARDICHYRRGSLNMSTIQDLMMFRCISKFDTDSEDYISNNEEHTLEEIQVTEELREAQLPQYTPDPISDDEEGEDDAPLIEASYTQPASQLQFRIHAPSQRAMGKRRKSLASLSETEGVEGETNRNRDEDEDDEIPLPTLNNEESQMRTSRRARKRPKIPDGFDVSYR